MKAVERIITGVSIAVFVVGAAALLVFSLPSAGVKALTVITGSMRPTMSPGTLAVMHRVPTNTLQVGDIITFTNPNNSKQTITHRIIRKQLIDNKVPGFVTRGDANSSEDAPIAAGAVQGKIIFHVAHAGAVINWAKRPVGTLVMVYVPALIIMTTESRRLARYYKSRESYKLAGYSVGSTSKTDGMNVQALLAVFVLLAPFAVAIPARALLSTSVHMTNNVIRADMPINQTHIEISEVFLLCSARNKGAAANQTPLIALYNPTSMNVNLKGWTLRDNSGVIMTFPNKTIHKRQVYIVSLYLPKNGLNGLQYAGDRLGLYAWGGQEVDGLSWGTDVSELDPSIQALSPGAHVRRKPIARDTNTAADWKITDARCPGEPRASSMANTEKTTVIVQTPVPNHPGDSRDTSATISEPKDAGAYTIAQVHN